MSHTFSINCVHCFITRLKKLKQETIFNINTHSIIQKNSHFTFRTTYAEFQTSTKIVPQGKLTSDHEIKQLI